MLRALDLSAEEKAAIRYLSFLTLKPTMYIANVNEDGFENNPYLDQVREIAAKEGSVVVPVCAAVEADIAELDDEERERGQERGHETHDDDPPRASKTIHLGQDVADDVGEREEDRVYAGAWAGRAGPEPCDPCRL